MRQEYRRNSSLTGMKECKQCKRQLEKYYNEDICPTCKEINLFSDVKDFIRSNNNVQEVDVATHFNIPISKVRAWIRDGRIEYKNSNGKSISGVHCGICGAKIAFGTICPDCYRLQSLQTMSTSYREPSQPGEMRFTNGRRYR